MQHHRGHDCFPGSEAITSIADRAKKEMTDQPKLHESWEKFDLGDILRSCSDSKCPLNTDKYFVFRKKDISTIQKSIEKASQLFYLKELETLKVEVDQSIRSDHKSQKENIPPTKIEPKSTKGRSPQINEESGKKSQISKSPVKEVPVSPAPSKTKGLLAQPVISNKPPERALKIVDTRGLLKEAPISIISEEKGKKVSQEQVESKPQSKRPSISPIPKSNSAAQLKSQSQTSLGLVSNNKSDLLPKAESARTAPSSPPKPKKGLPPPMNPGKLPADKSFYQLMETILNKPRDSSAKESKLEGGVRGSGATPAGRNGRTASSPSERVPMPERKEQVIFKIKIPTGQLESEELKSFRQRHQVMANRTKQVVVVGDADEPNEKSSFRLRPEHSSNSGYGKFSTVRPSLSELGGISKHFKQSADFGKSNSGSSRLPGLASVAPKSVQYPTDLFRSGKPSPFLKSKSPLPSKEPAPLALLGKRQTLQSLEDATAHSLPLARPKLLKLKESRSRTPPKSKGSVSRDIFGGGRQQTSQRQRTLLNADDWTLGGNSTNTSRSQDTRPTATQLVSADKRSLRRNH